MYVCVTQIKYVMIRTRKYYLYKTCIHCHEQKHEVLSNNFPKLLSEKDYIANKNTNVHYAQTMKFTIFMNNRVGRHEAFNRNSILGEA